MRELVKDFGKIQTAHPELQKTLSGLPQLQSSDKILILGDAGTGRRLLAQMIHESSHCSAAELVRYSPVQKIEFAYNSAVLVTDIQYLNSGEQEALFKQMQNTGDGCLWLATAQADFFDLVSRGLIRKDLAQAFTRKMKVPNLKERSQDLPFLIEQILLTLSWVTGRVLRVSTTAMTALENHFWSENIRELEQVLEAAALATANSVIEVDDLNLPSLLTANIQQITTLAEMEKKLILQTLQITQNNKSQAARRLGISIRTLRNKLSQYKTLEEVGHESNV